MSDSAGLVTEREFARTYDGDDYDDAWEAVEQYRRAITYHADNPDAGIGELVIDDGGTPAASRASTRHTNIDGSASPTTRSRR